MTAVQSKCPTCQSNVTGPYCASCGSPVSSTLCPVCASALPGGARFCHICGEPLGKKNPAPANIPWAGVLGVVLVIAVTAVIIVPRLKQTPAASSQVTAPVASGGGSPPDLSTMSPRERAVRLFDRIAEASDRGDTSQVNFFAPMAIQAYAALGTPDNDALYDTGMILALSGQTGEALARADTLQSRVPGHLLSMVIRATAAARSGDDSLLTEAYSSFLESYPSETGQSRVEYQAHRTTIDEFRTRARAAIGGQ